MTHHDKRIERLLSKPKDYTFSEATALLKSMGFELMNKGSTSGSRIIFYRKEDRCSILLHKPHPGNVLKSYVINSIIQKLKETGDIIE